MTIRVRFAPSPTGLLHVGGARTALFCWLQARRFGGQFILRIEDTDRERSTPESVQAILDGMEWLELDYDEGPVFQTDRMELYREYVQRLVAQGHAYPCYCSKQRLEEMREQQRAEGGKPRYDGRCRDRQGPVPDGIEPVLRFKNPIDGEVVVEDLIRGRMVFANAELDDLIIARPDGTPTYNFTVVVDDYEMRISHVIRGDDHINNTPRQMNILGALGAKPPAYAHVPMILGPDGQRLSKRHGAVSVMQFKDEGFLPAAMRNYLVRLGWSHGDQEIFSTNELCSLFDIEDVNRAASVFDMDKLLWLNQHYIAHLSASELSPLLMGALADLGINTEQGPTMTDVVEVQRDRAKTMVEMAEKSVFAFQEIAAYDAQAVRKHVRPDSLGPLRGLREHLASLPEWQPESLHAAVVACAQSHDVKLGKLAQPLRIALTGSAMSPSIEKTLLLVGKERSLARIDAALTAFTDLMGSA